MEEISSPCLQPLYNAESTNPAAYRPPLETVDYSSISGGYFGSINGVQVQAQPAGLAPQTSVMQEQPYAQPQQHFTRLQSPQTTMHSSPNAIQPQHTSYANFAPPQPLFGQQSSPRPPHMPFPTSPLPGDARHQAYQPRPGLMPNNSITDPYMMPGHSHLRVPNNHTSNPSPTGAYGNYGPPRPGFHMAAPYGSNGPMHNNVNTQVKRPFMGEVAEADSSSSTRESSHINRKKRKACGRCGPCQRKDNCGTCMNCVNRAKGKQICIYRKCEELKKKPGTDAYLPSNGETRQEKRKSTDNLLSPNDLKRSKSKEARVTPNQLSLLPATSQYQDFSSAKRFSPQAQPLNHLHHFNENISQGGQDTTDIISEALREIENIPESLSTNPQPVNFPPSQSFNNPSSAVPYQWDSTNSTRPSPNQGHLQTHSHATSIAPNHNVNIPQQTNQQAYFPTSVTSTASAVPDQLLSNLRRYNAPGSFQRNSSSISPSKAKNKDSKSSNNLFEVAEGPKIKSGELFSQNKTNSPDANMYNPNFIQRGMSGTSINSMKTYNYNNIPPNVASTQNINPMIQYSQTTPTGHQYMGNNSGFAHHPNSALQHTNLPYQNAGQPSGTTSNNTTWNPSMTQPPMRHVQKGHMHNPMNQYPGNTQAVHPTGSIPPRHNVPDIGQTQTLSKYNSNSAIGSLQSPVSSLVPGSPQAPILENTPITNMPQLSASPNTIQGTVKVESNNQNLQQGFDSGEIKQFAQTPTINSSNPASNHFLDQPGSSVKSQLPTTSTNGDFYVSLTHENYQPGKGVQAHVEQMDTALSVRNKLSNSGANSPNIKNNTSVFFTENSKNVSKLLTENITNMSSPVETNSISPGESGYDSAEMTNGVVEEMQSNTIQHQNFLGENKQQDSKNLIAASVGNQMRKSLDNSSNSASATGAMPKNNLEQKNLTYNVPFMSQHIKNTNITKSRNTSIDSTPELESNSNVYNFSSDESEVNKTPVRLRRFSNPNVPFSNLPGSFSPPHSVPSISDACVQNKTALSKSCSMETGKVMKVETPKIPLKVGMGVLDTPPMTPSSSASFMRKFSAEFSSNGSIYNNNIMPTPPYSSDSIWSSKKEQQFFANNPCIPTTSEPPMREPTFDEMRGIPKTFTTEVAGKTTTKTVYEYPKCNCVPGSQSEDDPPYYTHLGAARDVAELRSIFEKRTGFIGEALRIEKVIYTGKEGKTSRGCPIAKWIIRRSSETEKILIVCRHRTGHTCLTAYITVVVVLWEGLAKPLADYAYENYVDIIPKNTEPTERKCGTNETKTCACQGFNDEIGGASYSFGCSWSMYYNGCKFARSAQPKKFKLTASKDEELEKFVETLSTKLATVISPLYKMVTPHSHANQVEMEKQGFECRLGDNLPDQGRPFCGFTTCFDFCAHAHKDAHNMENGATVVVTLTKPELRQLGKRNDDEQLHVLPLYKLDLSNEQGTFDGVSQKIMNGSVEILNGYRRKVRLRDEPYLNKKKRQRMAKKKKISTMEDIGTPRKKRGRPPKRSLSVEDLTQIQNIDDKKSMLLPPNVQRSTIFNPQNHPIEPHLHGGAYPQQLLHNAPQRWPYRPPSDCGSRQNFPGQPVPPQRLLTPSQPSNISAAEHLPSIGSFFVEKNSPSENNNISGNALPSLSTIMSHPFHKSFSVVSNQSQDLNKNTDLNNNTTSAINSTPNRPPNAHLGTPIHSIPTPSIPQTPGLSRGPFNHNINSHLTHPGSSVNSTPENKINLKSYASNQDFMKQQDQPPALPSVPNPTPERTEYYSDSEENFRDSSIGGVAIAPTHGSVIIEFAKKELHATTPLLHPNRYNPSRISLVFYQHKSMNTRNHGAAEYEAKEEKRQQQRNEKKEQERLLAEKDRIAVEKEAEKNKQFFNPQLPTLQNIHQPLQNNFIKDQKPQIFSPVLMSVSNLRQETPNLSVPESYNGYKKEPSIMNYYKSPNPSQMPFYLPTNSMSPIRANTSYLNAQMHNQTLSMEAQRKYAENNTNYLMPQIQHPHFMNYPPTSINKSQSPFGRFHLPTLGSSNNNVPHYQNGQHPVIKPHTNYQTMSQKVDSLSGTQGVNPGYHSSAAYNNTLIQNNPLSPQRYSYTNNSYPVQNSKPPPPYNASAPDLQNYPNNLPYMNFAPK